MAFQTARNAAFFGGPSPIRGIRKVRCNIVKPELGGGHSPRDANTEVVELAPFPWLTFMRARLYKKGYCVSEEQ